MTPEEIAHEALAVARGLLEEFHAEEARLVDAKWTVMGARLDPTDFTRRMTSVAGLERQLREQS